MPLENIQSIGKQIPVAILTGIVITLVTTQCEAVHTPLLINLLLSIGLGWLQPKKGWILAIIQIISILISYFFIQQTQLIHIVKPDIAQFVTYISFAPTLAGSFIGGFFRRTLQ
jgi:hypothetical protein